MFLKLSLSAALIGVVIAAPSRRSSLVVHETRAAEPLDWVPMGRLDPNKVLPMRFGLAQENLHRIEEMLMAVSHPDSLTYGKHYTPAEIVDTFAPSNETISAVTNWLIDSGFARDRLRLSANRGWLSLEATTSEVEDLLNAEYYVYNHASGDKQFGCHNYSVPAHIRQHVDLINPTVHFNHRPSKLAVNERTGLYGNNAKLSDKAVLTTSSLSTCDRQTTLECLRALYSINYTPVATSRNSYGIVELTPQAYLGDDLDLFFANFSPSLAGVRPALVSVDGGFLQTTDQSGDKNAESNLDLQYAMGLTAPQPITLLQVGDNIEGGSFNDWLDAVDGSYCTFDGGDDPVLDPIYPDPRPGGYKGQDCGIIAPPFVVSISYGSDEPRIAPAYANRQCNEYAKLGMMGTSVLYASGDFGVAGFRNLCNDGRGQLTADGTMFTPSFPSNCPFVTAVGATQVNPGSSVNDPEGACEQVIFSGGGFSNVFSMPSYQATAVNNFLTSNPPPFTSAQFNNSGNARAYPDLSANGANYVVAINGKFGLVFGTSASSPVVGSMITLINDARLAAGKGPVGFLNPSIYSPSFASGFNDITSGGNQGCGTPGFTATTGWDPVTGVGTPNLTKLIPLFMALP